MAILFIYLGAGCLILFGIVTYYCYNLNYKKQKNVLGNYELI